MTRPDDTQLPVDAVIRFFHAIETGDWSSAGTLLTDPVDIAHGAHRQTLSNAGVISGWKETHEKFATTRYQIELVDAERTGHHHATARFDSRSTFTLAETAENVTRVIDGHYTVDLQQTDRRWQICSIRHDQA